MLKNLNVPLIKNYEDFKELNDRIKSSGRADLFRIQIIGVSYVYEEIKIVVDGDEGGMDFGDTIDIIGGFSFYLNETVREVSGSKVRTIGPFGFMGSTIEAVDFPNLYSLCPASFANTDLTEVSFPELSSISRGAFYQCHKLRRVNAPKCLLIKDLAFSGCDSLDEVIYSKDAILENDVYTQRGPVLLL